MERISGRAFRYPGWSGTEGPRPLFQSTLNFLPTGWGNCRRTRCAPPGVSTPPTTAARTLGLCEDAAWAQVAFWVSRGRNWIWVRSNACSVVNQIDVVVASSERVITREQPGKLVPSHEPFID